MLPRRFLQTTSKNQGGGCCAANLRQRYEYTPSETIIHANEARTSDEMASCQPQLTILRNTALDASVEMVSSTLTTNAVVELIDAASIDGSEHEGLLVQL